MRLRGLSKDLAHQVQEIVIGLQAQDIISQKFEDVTAALPQIEARLHKVTIRRRW